jgi:hypothetical protein
MGKTVVEPVIAWAWGDSAVYNPSTRYFQPNLIEPLRLTKSATVKAFAAGYGKDRSPTATFNYTVK